MSRTTPRMAPTPETPATAPAPEQPARRRSRPVGLIIAVAMAIALIAALKATVLWPDDEGNDATTGTTTEAPATTATTAQSTTRDTEPASTAAPTPAAVDSSTAVFPDGGSGERYTDPVAAARAFAVDFVGFTDPIVGEFMQGDARSGEVDVRPMDDGPVTTVFVRQLGADANWWVLGSATADIVADSPAPGDLVRSPVAVSGSALAFEGTVGVEVREDGSRSPLGTGFVTGGGDAVRPFSGQILFSPPAADHGALVFLTRSEEDGRVWEAAVIRVRFR